MIIEAFTSDVLGGIEVEQMFMVIIVIAIVQVVILYQVVAILEEIKKNKKK